jgi:hypothetical protein
MNDVKTYALEDLGLSPNEMQQFYDGAQTAFGEPKQPALAPKKKKTKPTFHPKKVSDIPVVPHHSNKKIIQKSS